MMTIVDYGVGNVQAFMNVFKRLSLPAVRAKSKDELHGAAQIILPGVGSFDHTMRQFNQSGMRETVEELVVGRGVPVLGVCVGMQMLAAGSDEGDEAGLGWIPGRVRSFRTHPAAAAMPQPHMGWNDVRPAAGARLFDGLDATSRFYFLHSYYFESEQAADNAAATTYGLEFPCAVQRHNVYGVQFHPEKSHHFGERLLKNFSMQTAVSGARTP